MMFKDFLTSTVSLRIGLHAAVTPASKYVTIGQNTIKKLKQTLLENILTVMAPNCKYSKPFLKSKSF